MISGFLVKKGQMTSVYTSEGKRIAVTKCLAPSLKVTQIKTEDKDGYSSVQIAYGTKKHLDKAVASKIDKLKLNIKPQFFKEFKLTSDRSPKLVLISLSNLY